MTRPEPYRPSPIDTSGVALTAELDALTERLAENWTWGEQRSDTARTHPGLVPYALLSDSEKEYDRTSARKTLLAVIALGYRVIPPEAATPGGDVLTDVAALIERGAK